MIETLFQFDRQCEQAIELYKEAFGAELILLMRYHEANPKDLPPKYNAQTDSDLVYHAQMMFGDRRILLCDNLFNDLPRGHSVYPVATLKTADEVKAAFDILSDGATIVSSPIATTYCSCVCTLVDRYGIFWDLMAEK